MKNLKSYKIGLLWCVIGMVLLPEYGAAQRARYEKYISFSTPLIEQETTNEKGLYGSPYLNKEWLMGDMVIDQDTIAPVLFRYNLFHQKMEFIYQQDTLSIAQPLQVKKLSFSGMEFSYGLVLDGTGADALLSGAWFQLLEGSDLQLLMKRKIGTHENSYMKNYMGGGGDGRMVLKVQEYLYLRTAGGAARKVHGSTVKMLRLLGIVNDDLVQHIRKNKLNTPSERNLRKVIAYYHSHQE